MVFLVLVHFEDEVNEHSSWKVFIAICLVIEFQLQSATNQILESFLNINIL